VLCFGSVTLLPLALHHSGWAVANVHTLLTPATLRAHDKMYTATRVYS